MVEGLNYKGLGGEVKQGLRAARGWGRLRAVRGSTYHFGRAGRHEAAAGMSNRKVSFADV